MVLDRLYGKITNLSDLPNIVNNLSFLKGVSAVILFGSQLTGKTHIHSDIDLCVVSDNSNSDLEDDLLDYESDNLQISIFKKLPLPIQFRVLKEGRILFQKDKNEINSLKLKVLSSYLDIKPLINRYCQERFGCTI